MIGSYDDGDHDHHGLGRGVAGEDVDIGASGEMGAGGGPPSLPIEKTRKETTIRVTFCQGSVIFGVLLVIYVAIMCASIYVGWWINLHDEDDYALVVTGGRSNRSGELLPP